MRQRIVAVPPKSPSPVLTDVSDEDYVDYDRLIMPIGAKPAVWDVVRPRAVKMISILRENGCYNDPKSPYANQTFRGASHVEQDGIRHI